MKKAFFLASILLISVISTACINNFAVQELNNKAKEFMDKGDYVSAIERLKSSVDLDGTVFETRYNLAVAYTNAEDYVNAVNAFSEALKLNPDSADAYYSLAVCEENLAKDILSGNVKVFEDGSLEKAEETSADFKPDKTAEAAASEYLGNAVSDYKTYLEKVPDAASEVNDKIQELETLLSEHASDV